MIESATESFGEATLPTVIRTLGTQRRTQAGGQKERGKSAGKAFLTEIWFKLISSRFKKGFLAPEKNLHWMRPN